ncbi:MAG: hypothetical protein PVJ57_05635 [Phycisphaerae bacterium]|jgi:hypothetical protein
MSNVPPIASRPDFRAQAEHVLYRVRRAIAEVIASVPGFTYCRPNDLANELGLDAKLGWNIGRSIEGPDPFASARFLPGPTGMSAFLNAARRRQTPREAIESARQAFEAFSELVRTHAGTRNRFNALAAALATTDCVRADVEHRRLTFEGNTYLWGVHARTIFRANIAHPSTDHENWDVITVRGFVDFRRIRPNVAWRIRSSHSVDAEHNVHSETRAVPLDPRVTEGHVPLLTDFCTQPTPGFRRIFGPYGEPQFEFVESSVGNSSRFSCVTGELLGQVEPRYRSELYNDFCFAFSSRTPAEVLVFDVLIHSSLMNDTAPFAAELYSDLFGGGPEVRYEPNDRLPLHESVEHLGRGPEAARTADVPRYPEMLRYAIERAGWNRADFELYRLRLQYPPLPTTIMLRKPLPERPARSDTRGEAG